MQEAQIVYNHDILLEEAGSGVQRKILSYTPQIMIVEVHFQEGGIGTLHTHPHEQMTYIRSGRFRFTIDGKTVEVSEGDTISFPSAIPHGTLCLEAGILLDIFHPMREDFIK